MVPALTSHFSLLTPLRRPAVYSFERGSASPMPAQSRAQPSGHSGCRPSARRSPARRGPQASARPGGAVGGKRPRHPARIGTSSRGLRVPAAAPHCFPGDAAQQVSHIHGVFHLLRPLPLEKGAHLMTRSPAHSTPVEDVANLWRGSEGGAAPGSTRAGWDRRSLSGVRWQATREQYRRVHHIPKALKMGVITPHSGSRETVPRSGNYGHPHALSTERRDTGWPGCPHLRPWRALSWDTGITVSFQPLIPIPDR